MTTLTENPHTGEFIASEAPGTRSREQITLVGDGTTTIKAGTVLARRVDADDVTVAAPVADAGNTGNGTFAATPTVDDGAMAGNWRIVITEPGSNTGEFEVRRPDGTLEGSGTVASAYNGEMNFTLQDGATDFVAGDAFTVNVSYDEAADTVWGAYNQDATNGFQYPAGILYAAKIGTTGGVSAVAFARDGEVNGNLLTWPADITAAEKAEAIQQLAAIANIHVRT